MKQKTTSVTSNPSQQQAFIRLFIFMWRFMTRLFFLPLYAMLLAPWIIIIDKIGNTNLNDYAFRVVALLAGKPSATELDEGDIAGAVVVVVIVVSVLTEVYSRFRGKQIDEKYEKQRLKKQLYVQAGLSVIGWSAAAAVFYGSEGLALTLVLVFLGFVLAFFFAVEYFNRVFIMKMLEKFLRQS